MAATVTSDQVDDVRTRLQVGNLVGCQRERQVGCPVEILGLDVACGEGCLKTTRFHRCHVSILRNHTTDTLRLDDTNQVVVVTPVGIEGQVDAVVEETEVNTHVELLLLLVCQL